MIFREGRNLSRFFHCATKNIVGAVVLCGFFFPSASLLALTIHVESDQKEYGPGDTFIVTVRAENVGDDECFNAADIILTYPPDLLNASAISRGESFFTLWPEEPSISKEKGTIHIAGGIPAGYCGRVVGDPGRTNIIVKAIFSVPGFQIGGRVISTSTPITIGIAPESKVFLNDGFGTSATVTYKDLFLMRMLSSKGVGNEWLASLHDDTVPPEVFTPTVESDAQTFGGKYFLVFSAIDKGSGIDHVEVTEEDPVHPGFLRGSNYDRAVPFTTNSPYVLKDQELHSTIIVTAYDIAGNSRRVEVTPPAGTSTVLFSSGGGSIFTGWRGITLLAALILLVLGGGLFFFTRSRRRAPPLDPIHHEGTF